MLAPDPRFSTLDSLDGRGFELAVVELLQLLGYDHVEHIGGFDKGADITFVRGEIRVAVQAKRYSGSVGIGAVRQLIDGMRRYQCDEGLVVTNSFFTAPAAECAREWGIELWDRRTLAEFVAGEPPEVDQTLCAECGQRVTAGITKWCLDHPDRFLGNVYCRRHQRRSTRRD